MQKINPCLWFNSQAEEAAKFYTSVFKNSQVQEIARYGASGAQVSGQKAGSVMTVQFELEGQTILGLNGGPEFKFTPALSFFIWCETEKEVDDLWKKFSYGGEVRMGLDKYPWAQKYGWTADKYGVDWQIILSPNKQKIAPAFLFVNKHFGKGEEAINFYTSLFKNSKIDSISRDEKTNTVMHCIFTLEGQQFALMEGAGTHHFDFSHAFSLTVNCKDQSEIDYYWENLSKGGSVEPCGWVKDKYGVSWQITPTSINKMMTDPDSEKAERVMKEMLKMKKIDLKSLEKAYGK